MAKEKKPSTLQLLARLPKQIFNVVTVELANARAEVGSRVKNLVLGILLFVLALVFMFWTIAVLLTAAIAGLGQLLPIWASALIIGAVGVLATVICVAVGVMLVKHGNPVPSQTIARIKEDLANGGEIKKNLNQLKTQPGKKGTQNGEAGVWK